MIEDLKKINERYCADYSKGNAESKGIFEFTDFASVLILSAPHATRSFVCKKDKPSDLFTGALTEYMGIKNNISTLIRCKYTPYKALISDYILEQHLTEHYFLDIHGFNKDIGFDVCLGVGYYEPDKYPYVNEIKDIFSQYGMRVAINHPDYCGKIGLTGRYQNAFDKPNVIQIEIHRRLRDFYKNPDIVKNITIPALDEIVQLYPR